MELLKLSVEKRRLLSTGYVIIENDNIINSYAQTQTLYHIIMYCYTLWYYYL